MANLLPENIKLKLSLQNRDRNSKKFLKCVQAPYLNSIYVAMVSRASFFAIS